VGVTVLNSPESISTGERKAQAIERLSKAAIASRSACAFRPGLILLGYPDYILHEERR
jgi:glutathione synthase/RimK-type ligase-like ATP-grasp enzyme